MEKKSKTKLKKVVGKNKHKSGKGMAVNKGKGRKEQSSSLVQARVRRNDNCCKNN